MRKELALSAMLIALATGAQAQNLVTMGTVGVWDIMVDPVVGNGCLIMASFEDGSDVRIGFDAENEAGYVLALNHGWDGVVEDQIYTVTLDVDGSQYEGEGTGTVIDGKPGVDIAFEDVEFLMDVASKNTLSLINHGETVMAIDLKDSAAALVEAIACQEKQG